MANIIIEKIERKSGTRYKARLRVDRNNQRLFEKSKTFAKEMEAKKWAKTTLQEIKDVGASSYNATPDTVLIGDLITLYLNDPITSKDIGNSKASVLRRLRSYEIALVQADQLTANHLVQHCRTRLSEPSAPLPQTIYHDITYLRSVINVAGPMFGFRANIHAHTEAIPTLVKYGMIGRSNRRDRRPTKAELHLAEEGLRSTQGHHASTIPLVDIFHISILTCMRLGEITRIKWDDLDIEASTVTIRDRKNPRNKRGNHCKIPLFEEALAIVLRQPKINEKIFPYKSTSISRAWQRMCAEQGLVDLHYHDLRAEGACQLFERGLNIVEISKITGHRDINVLNNIYLRVGISVLHQNRLS